MRSIPRSAWIAATISGILQALCFPSPAQYWLCWIALAPLWVALLGGFSADCKPLTPRAAFLVGYASGIVWYALTCYWIYHVMHVYGGLPGIVSAGLVVLFCLYLGLYHGFFAWAMVSLARNPHIPRRPLMLVIPVLWVAVELARARITGFPWDLLGTALVDNIPINRIATITGVYGLSWLIAMVNMIFVAGWLAPREQRRKLLASALTTAVGLQLSALTEFKPLPAPYTARLVQQNVPILDTPWTADFYDTTIASLAQLSHPSPPAEGRGRADLIIWPESPAPFWSNDPKLHHWLSALASDANAYLIIGSVGVKRKELRNAEEAATAPQLLNSALLITPSGDIAARYDKLHLVPFGEYVPFQTLLGFAQKLTKEVGDFTPGDRRVVFNLPSGPGALSRTAAVFICYESIFPDEIREFVGGGAQVLVNISNDGWFGETGAPRQHLNMVRMRAIENRRWVLRATNTGITGSIDSYGRVVASLPRNTRAALDAPYNLNSRITFYTRHGDWFAFTCAIIAVLALLSGFLRKH